MIDSATLLAAQLNDRITTIDLHEAGSIADALLQLDQGLYSISQNGDQYCRVIHGIGTGRLEQAVHESLAVNPMVAHVEKESGSCLVFF